MKKKEKQKYIVILNPGEKHEYELYKVTQKRELPCWQSFTACIWLSYYFRNISLIGKTYEGQSSKHNFVGRHLVIIRYELFEAENNEIAKLYFESKFKTSEKLLLENSIWPTGLPF